MAAAAAAGAAGAMIRAARASGVIVQVEPRDFEALVRRLTDPLVVTSRGGLFRKSYDYLTSYKGLAFYTRSPEPIQLPASAEVVAATKIWIPGR